MSSLMAESVAMEKIRQVEKGGDSAITTIAPKKGYSPATARSGKIQKTKAYKDVIEPVAIRWEKERERITKAMEQRNLNEVEYRDLSKVLDTLTQNIQLLNGGATAHIATKVLVEFIDAIQE